MKRLLAGLTAVLVMLVPQSMPALATVPDDPGVAADQVLTWTAGDSVTEYTSAPTTAVAGATTIVFENSAATGNTTGMSHTLTFDTSTPGYNHDVPLNINANPFDANDGRHEAQVTLTPGKYRYFCAIPGHGTMVGEFTVTDGTGEDTTPPTVAAQVSGQQNTDGHYLGRATVTVTAADTQSGVASVEYELDDTGFRPYSSPVVVTALGDHSVQYRATDVAGNVSQTGSVSFRVVEPPADSTPPAVSAVVSGDQDADGNYLDTARVTVTAADTESGVKTVEYQLDDGAWTAYTAPVDVSTPGMHMLHYRATDNAGNTSPVGMAHFTVVERDTTPPVVTAAITGEKDADGSYIAKATVTLTAQDAGSGVQKVEYRLDGGAWTAYTTPVEVTTTGAHTVGYRATDVAGNTSAAGTSSFTVVQGTDTTAPSVSGVVTGNQNSRWEFVGQATLTVSATDAGSGVASIEYALDDGGWTAYTGPVAIDTAGKHTVRCRATDAAGNVSAELSGSFTVVKSRSGKDRFTRRELR